MESRKTRILEWVAIPFSGGSSWPRDRTQIFCIAGGFFTVWAMREAPWKILKKTILSTLKMPRARLNSSPGQPLGSTHSHPDNLLIRCWRVEATDRTKSNHKSRERDHLQDTIISSCPHCRPCDPQQDQTREQNRDRAGRARNPDGTKQYGRPQSTGKADQRLCRTFSRWFNRHTTSQKSFTHSLSYLAELALSCTTRTLSWDLVPWPGIKPQTQHGSMES